MNRLDVAHERACMATPRDEYYTNMLETLINHNYRHSAPLSSEKIRQSVIRVMAETKEAECDPEYNANNVTMYNLFNHSTISPPKGDIANVTSFHSTIPPSQEDANVTNERRIASGIMKKG